MASGRIVKNLVSTGRVQLITEWSSVPNKNNNTSTVTVKNSLYFAGKIVSTATKSGSITIGGTKYNYSYVIGNHPNGVTKVIGTASRVVSHNSAGELSITISTNNSLGVTYAGVYISTADNSFTARMDKIPRNSTIGTVSNFTSPTGSPSVQIIAADPNFTHVIDFKINNKRLFSRGGLKGGSHNLALSTAEQDLVLREVANSPTAIFTVVLGTYNNGVWTGSAQQKNGTVTVASNIVPTIVSIQWEDDIGADPTSGYPVVDVSRLKITTEAVGTKFAKIALIEVNYNGFKYNGSPIVTNVIVGVTDYRTISVTVTDTRGRKTTSTTPVYASVIGFPDIGTRAYRSNANGDANISGKFLKVIAQIETMGVHARNAWWIQYRRGDSTTWTTLYYGGEESVYFEQVYDLNLDVNSSYELRTVVDNMLHRATETINIPTDTVILDVRANGKGLGIGKVSEKDALEIAFWTEIRNRLDVITPTNNSQDNALIRLYRSDRTLMTELNYDKTGNNLVLHRYNANGQWASAFTFRENGEMMGSKLVTVIEWGTNFKKYSDGTMEQWGRGIAPVTSVNVGQQQNQTYPIPFVGAVPSLQLTSQIRFSEGECVVISETLSSFTTYTLRKDATYSTRYSWHAWGRWK